MNQDQWDLYLDAILFSYRISRQDSTKFSQFSQVNGRIATLSVDLKSAQSKDIDYSNETSIADKNQKRKTKKKLKKIKTNLTMVCTAMGKLPTCFSSRAAIFPTGCIIS